MYDNTEVIGISTNCDITHNAANIRNGIIQSKNKILLK